MPKKRAKQVRSLPISPVSRERTKDALTQRSSQQKLVDAWAEIRFTNQAEKDLRSDPFFELFFRLAEVYGSLGEPFIAPATRETPAHLKLPLYKSSSGPSRTKANDAPQRDGQDTAAFLKSREKATEETLLRLLKWNKSGIPTLEVMKILNRIEPKKRKAVAHFARYHQAVTASLKKQLDICIALGVYASPQVDLVVLPEHLRTELSEFAAKAVVQCTEAMQKMKDGHLIIQQMKNQFLNIKSLSKRDAEQALMNLRARYIPNERKTDRALRTAELLETFDNSIEWNPDSIRAGRAYR
jgi:hypothetical protein